MGLLFLASSAALAGGNVKQTANVMNQGLTLPVVAENGAQVIRTSNGITISLTMPTPVPGSYNYPPTGSAWQPAPVAGFPEVFSGWAFIFNAPEECASSPCAGPTPVFAEGRFGAYNFAGHVVGSGGTLNLVGHISLGESVFPHPNPDARNPLDNPMGAEVHIAIAPHGMLLPDAMPDQINTPVGSPADWWVSVFLPPEE